MWRSGISVAAIFIGACCVFLLVAQWHYLGQGYSLQVSLGGHSKVYHIDFPASRRWLLLATGLLLFGGLVLLAIHRTASIAILGCAFAAVLIVGFQDVSRYGFIGSPTSWRLVVLMAAALALSVLAKRMKLDV